MSSQFIEIEISPKIATQLERRNALYGGRHELMTTEEWQEEVTTLNRQLALELELSYRTHLLIQQRESEARANGVVQQ